MENQENKKIETYEPQQIKFSVKEKYIQEGDKTICILTLKNAWKYKIILDALNMLEEYGFSGGIKKTKFPILTKFKCIVTCKPGDTYDSKTGKREARIAAYKKFDKWKKNYLSTVYKSLQDILYTLFY